MTSKRNTVDTAPWPCGVWEVTESEYRSAQADRGINAAEAWQVVRYCNGWPFIGDSVKAWLKQHRATDAKFDALRAVLG